MISGVYTNLEKRKISQETCKKFNYQVGKHEGNSVQIANYYDKNNNVVAQHLRYPNKDFKWLGNSRTYNSLVNTFGKKAARCLC